eukprot:3805371-Pyramimonas_sp.AAC.1
MGHVQRAMAVQQLVKPAHVKEASSFLHAITDMCTVDYDGFMVVTVHQQGHSFVLIVHYGYCSVGFGGDNVGRMSRLGASVQCLQLPWVIAGDCNIDVSQMLESRYLQRLGGHVLRAPVQHTCVSSKGQSHIDYFVASSSCLPYIRSVEAVEAVPWKPRCGASHSFSAVRFAINDALLACSAAYAPSEQADVATHLGFEVASRQAGAGFSLRDGSWEKNIAAR